MKKWEKPKLQDLRLEQTESEGPQRLECTTCSSSYNAQPELIPCYRCPCCRQEFHKNTYPNPYQEALRHIATMHSNGKCS